MRTTALGRLEERRFAAALAAPRRAQDFDLEQTACYACTGWHTCLVFLTGPGVRVPLCEDCLRQLVPRAIEAS